MGRLNAYVAAESLGDGSWVGERATLASQAAVRELRERLGVATRQIGASMRSGEQVETLAGLDVYTMPCAVARAFLERAPACEDLFDRSGEDYRPSWAPGVVDREEGFASLWEVPDEFRAACDQLGSLDSDALQPDAIVQAVNRSRGGAIFPQLEQSAHAAIAAEGKLPKRKRWKAALGREKIGLDSLFTLAGLYSFAGDQRALDDRIRQHLE